MRYDKGGLLRKGGLLTNVEKTLKRSMFRHKIWSAQNHDFLNEFRGVQFYANKCAFHGFKHTFYGKKCVFYGLSTVCLWFVGACVFDTLLFRIDGIVRTCCVVGQKMSSVGQRTSVSGKTFKKRARKNRVNSETHPAKLTAVDLTVAGFLCRLQPMQRMSLGLVLVLFLALWVG